MNINISINGVEEKRAKSLVGLHVTARAASDDRTISGVVVSYRGVIWERDFILEVLTSSGLYVPCLMQSVKEQLTKEAT